MLCKTYEIGHLETYRFVVVLSRYQGKILLSRHHKRDTWETQGGHIELGETPLEAARRELYEESGAVRFDIEPLCDYWYGERSTGERGNGRVFTAEIHKLGPIPESEMAEIRAFDALPEKLTYPQITPVLFKRWESGVDTRDILIGTTNPSKVGYFETLLAGAPVRFVTPKDLEIDEDPEENGQTPVENAKIKAAFYGQYADAVICADSGLYFDGLALDDPRQPGLHVRTPGGCARLDDEQMIAYYTQLVHSLGGHALAYYLDGIAIKVGKEIFGFQATREEARAKAFYMLDHPCACANWQAGWPLDSLSMDIDKVPFLDPMRGIPQMQSAYKARLRAFLLEKLGL